MSQECNLGIERVQISTSRLGREEKSVEKGFLINHRTLTKNLDLNRAEHLLSRNRFSGIIKGKINIAL